MTDFLALTQVDLQQGLTTAQRTAVREMLVVAPLLSASLRTPDPCFAPPAYGESDVHRNTETEELAHAR